jgi:predicted nucleic acid-binding protein
MRALRVYVDTSVFGGMFDIEYAKETRYFFKRVREGRFRLTVSDQVHIEIDPAPPAVKHLFETELANIEYLTPSPKVKELADRYIARKVLTEKYRSDAIHIAYATIHKCDGIISWNFVHMVKLNKMVRYNMINAENNYSQLFIASPKEVREHENA